MGENSRNAAGGLTLSEAIRHYVGDVEAWHEYEQAAHQVPRRPPPTISSVVRDSPTWHRHQQCMSQQQYASLVAKRNRLWRPMERDFRQQFFSGKLVGTGYVAPLQHGAERVRIGPAHWSRGKLNWRTSAVTYAGLTYIDVRVFPGEAPSIVIEDAPTPAEESLSGEEIEPVRPPGRPSYMNLIVEEFYRRVDCDELDRDSLDAECRALARWFESQHSDKKPYKWRSLRDPLRPHYRKVVRRKK